MGIYTLSTVFWFTGVQYLLWLPLVLLDIDLMIYMIHLGMAVDCAITNEIFGEETVERFKDFSIYYIFWALAYFDFTLFIDPMITATLGLTSAATFGLGTLLLIPYEIFSHYGAAFFTLYWTNTVYEAFHPVVAPEVVEAAYEAAGIDGPYNNL